jgi:hypothetical protein
MIMNDNMKLVLKALRSGEYKQTKAALQDEDGYCCLGVMCDVYRKETGAELVLSPFGRGTLAGGDLGDQEGVREWVGLVHREGDSEGHPTLAELNDSNNCTFSQIADFIESEPEGLLV